VLRLLVGYLFAHPPSSCPTTSTASKASKNTKLSTKAQIREEKRVEGKESRGTPAATTTK